MNTTQQSTSQHNDIVLVLGGTGKTGSRIAHGLAQRGIPVRIGSRSASPGFDWNNPAGWDACLDGVSAVYLNYAPDLAVPGAVDAIRSFTRLARQRGVQRVVLLSGRGEAEAQSCEKVVQQSGMNWTIVRASWFYQNFSEGAFIEMVRAGQITLPAGDVQEPFVDVDDIAAVALAALTDPSHHGQIYEVTGPRLMDFSGLAVELSRATGREIRYQQIPHDAFVQGVKHSGAPGEVVWLMDYLFATVLDGRNAYLCDGVQRALGRAPRDFAEYARETAASGVWR